MDISINIHDQLSATAGYSGSGSHWVSIKKQNTDEYADMTLFVPSYTAAQKLAAAINEAFAKPDLSPEAAISQPGALA